MFFRISVIDDRQSERPSNEDVYLFAPAKRMQEFPLVPTRSSWRAFKNPGGNGSVSQRKIPKATANGRQSLTKRRGKVRTADKSRARARGRGEGGNRARSPRYFVQITHAAVICEIPVILHFKLENKTARPEAAVLIRPAGSRCYRPQSRLPCRKQAEHECSENYSSPVRGVSVTFPFSFSFLSPFPSLDPPAPRIPRFSLPIRPTRATPALDPACSSGSEDRTLIRNPRGMRADGRAPTFRGLPPR